jgi:hypothetical protein
VFNCSDHPKVKVGLITEDQAFDEIIRNFNDRFGNGKIERCEWNDYYYAVSFSVQNDEHFNNLIKSVWKLD